MNVNDGKLDVTAQKVEYLMNRIPEPSLTWLELRRRNTDPTPHPGGMWGGYAVPFTGFAEFMVQNTSLRLRLAYSNVLFNSAAAHSIEALQMNDEVTYAALLPVLAEFLMPGDNIFILAQTLREYAALEQ